MLHNNGYERYRERRGENPPISLFSTSIRVAFPLSSALANLRPSSLEEDEEPAEKWRTRKVCGAKFQDHRGPIEIGNVKKFLAQKNQMIKWIKTSKKAIGPIWVGHSIPTPMGPTNIVDWMAERLDFDAFEAFARYYALMRHEHPVMNMFIEKRGSAEDAKRIGKELLKITEVEPLFIAPPHADFLIKIAHGQEPELIQMSDLTTTLITIEDFFFRTDPLHHFKKRFGDSVRSVRPLYAPEVESIVEKCGRLDRRRCFWSIEFFSPEERNRAARRAEHVDVFYCESSFDPMNITRTADLKIFYNYQNCQGVRLTLKYEVTGVLEQIFRDHKLKVCKDADEVNVLVITDFPPHHNRFDQKKWFVEQICKLNYIGWSYIMPVFDEMKELPDKEDMTYKVLSQIDDVARSLGIIAQGDIRWEYGLEVDRELLDVLLFTVSEEREGILFNVLFKTTEIGIQLLNGLMERLDRDQYLLEVDGLIPTIIPRLAVQKPISRRMRFACGKEIDRLDAHHRHRHNLDAEQQSHRMKFNSAASCGVRIVDEWETDAEMGFIKVEGWSERNVNQAFEDLQNILSPIKLNCRNHNSLLYGVGEAYVRSLPKQFEMKALVDIDKFHLENNAIGGLIRIFGDSKQAVLRCLETFEARKNQLEIWTSIPHTLACSSLTESMDCNHRDLGLSLNAFCKTSGQSGTVEFRGTVEAYEMVAKALEEIDEQLYQRRTRSWSKKERAAEQKKTPEQRQLEEEEGKLAEDTCYCLLKVGVTEDFFRKECGHVLCIECTRNMVRAAISDRRFVIPCGSCGEPFTPDEIKYIVLGGSNRLKELDVEKWRFVFAKAQEHLAETRRDVEVCPTPDCLGLCHDAGYHPQTALNCGICDSDYCSTCFGRAHGGSRCLRKRGEHDLETKIYMEREGVKKCPKCGLATLKDGGCNHITCTVAKCGAHWCWLCEYLASDIGDCYKHMRAEHQNDMYDFEFGDEAMLVHAMLQWPMDANLFDEHD
ncbi:unnamed protein product [Caenorhabditis sp. 36 PRJEB53466]|nr:unnamed protein product [Caenorhabditis sp. 36 PRJEB53466]